MSTGTIRHSSQSARATRRPVLGWKVRPSSSGAATVRRSRTAGDPSHDEPAFDFLGAADSTATRPSRGTVWPAAAIPELPFGGVKKSGHGREKGFEALYEFSASKTVVINHG